MAYKYHRVRINRDKLKDEHRIIMESIIERELEPGEVVHHINGNINDNRPENLAVMTLSEHSRLHMPKGRKLPQSTIDKLKITNQRPSKFRRLSDEDIEFIRNSKMTTRALGEMFNMNHSTICDIKNYKTYKDYTKSVENK